MVQTLRLLEHKNGSGSIIIVVTWPNRNTSAETLV